MTKRFLVVGMFLSVVLIFTCNSWAQDEYECCCQVECCYDYNYLTDPFTIKEYCTTLNEYCTDWSILLEELCEGDFQATMYCIEFALEVRAKLEKRDVEHEGENILFFQYSHHVGNCELVSSASCSSESLLGGDEPELDILRQFRDEVLSKSEKGKKLIDAYYNHGDVLIKAFEENPGIEAFATEILEKTIERLYSSFGSEEELLTDEIAADIDILADELDMVVTSPVLKKTLRQIKGDMRKGTLFE